MTPDWSRITAVLITHHSAAVIGDCLKNFTDVPNIVLVDNASDDETLDIVRATVPQAKIVKNKIGMGYANAANLGLSHVETEFMLTVNPDSVVLPDAVEALLQAADRNPEAAIICPQNINLDGSVELTHDVPVFERQNFPAPFNKRDLEPEPEGDLCAEFVSGAVNLLRVEKVRPLGGFDTNIFLYFEDDDMCMRIREAGHVLILTPSAKIMHINAGSVRPSLHYKWEKFWNYGWARLYLQKKYKGTGAMLALAVQHIGRFLFKALLYTLTFNFKKSLRDWARLAGTLAFLFGAKAVNPNWSSINKKARGDQA